LLKVLGSLFALSLLKIARRKKKLMFKDSKNLFVVLSYCGIVLNLSWVEYIIYLFWAGRWRSNQI